MNQLRAAQDSDPVRARQLAEEGMRRFPNSPDAAEREALGIKAYARQGRISEARAEAERMVNRYPGSKWALEVERHTGAHPIR
jgi:outer membrane protein assembly factor BamD (BamD/ComL family)